MATRWSEQEVNQLKAMDKMGLTAMQISKLVDKSVHAVQMKLNRTKTDEVVDIISTPELAEKIGMIRTNLSQYLKRSGIKPYLVRKKALYYKKSDVQKLMDNGFALVCVSHHERKQNDVWDMVNESMSRLDLVTTREKICKAFGVYNSSVGYWLSNMQFPAPIARIHNVGHIFNIAEVEEWAKKNQRTHGSLKISAEEFTQSNGFQDGE